MQMEPVGERSLQFVRFSNCCNPVNPGRLRLRRPIAFPPDLSNHLSFLARAQNNGHILT